MTKKAASGGKAAAGKGKGKDAGKGTGSLKRTADSKALPGKRSTRAAQQLKSAPRSCKSRLKASGSAAGANGISKPKKGMQRKQQKPIQLKSKATVKATLKEERERLLKLLLLNEKRQQQLSLKNDDYKAQASHSGGSKKGRKGGMDDKITAKVFCSLAAVAVIPLVSLQLASLTCAE